jgi:hypothetical protein
MASRRPGRGIARASIVATAEGVALVASVKSERVAYVASGKSEGEWAGVAQETVASAALGTAKPRPGVRSLRPAAACVRASACRRAHRVRPACDTLQTWREGCNRHRRRPSPQECWPTAVSGGLAPLCDNDEPMGKASRHASHVSARRAASWQAKRKTVLREKLQNIGIVDGRDRRRSREFSLTSPLVLLISDACCDRGRGAARGGGMSTSATREHVPAIASGQWKLRKLHARLRDFTSPHILPFTTSCHSAKSGKRYETNPTASSC